jgi:hypothetical protein
VKRVDIETNLNESRNLTLAFYAGLTDEQLCRPLTKSEHDPRQLWSALDHFGHIGFIEGNFNEMIRRHLSHRPNPVGLLADDAGTVRTREQVLAIVHASNDRFQGEHRGESLSAVVAFTARARSATLQLLAELSDEQLDEPLEGAPWGDGTLGGVLGANFGHAHMHWRWVVEAGLLLDGGDTAE